MENALFQLDKVLVGYMLTIMQLGVVVVNNQLGVMILIGGLVDVKCKTILMLEIERMVHIDVVAS